MTIDPSTTTNYMQVLMEALSVSNDTATASQNSANGDLNTADFMHRLYQMLAKYNGDMKAIESFLTSFIAYHQQDAQMARLSGVSSLSLQAVSKTLDQVKADQAKIDDLQKKIDDSQNKLVDLANQAAEIGTEMEPANVAKWVAERAGWTFIYGPLGAVACSAAAAARYACLAQDLKNVAGQIDSVKNQLSSMSTEMTGLQKDQTALISGTTGKIDARATTLAGQANATLGTAKQILQLSLMLANVMAPSGSN
ncbi:MAG: hypothetical protein HYX48_03465 [Chlamydiales bacterium]|nr:hypothetical protein [Chlamydiales bacterium]